MNDRAYLDLYLRHRNYSEMPYYGPGPDSSKFGRTSYRLEDMSYDLSAGLKPLPRLRIGVTGGFLEMNVGPGGSGEAPSTERIYNDRQSPGISQQSDFLRGGVLAHLDMRDNPYGPRAGGQYYARFDHYDDRTFRQFSFRRLTAEVQQFVPCSIKSA